MLEVQELVASHLPWTLQVRALPAATTSITRVTLVEDLERAQGVEPGALVVLTRATAEAAGGYQLDVLVRHAAQRGTAAILLRRSTRHSITAEALAVRAGVALIDVDDDADPADLVDTLGTLVAGDSRSAVRKLATAASQAANYDSDPHEVVQRIGDTCGVRLEYDAAATEGGAAITVEGTQRGIVRAIDRGDIATIAARLAAVVVAETVGRRERLVLSPMRTASAALGQLLTCSQANLAIVAERAAEAGLLVSGWHCAARIAVDHPHSNDVRAELPLLEQEVLALVADRAGIDRAMWTVSRPDDSVVLVRTTRNDSHRDGSRLVQAWLQQVGIILRDGHPGLRFRIGIATPHEGASGLRLSAEESRTALAAARMSDEAVNVATFDSLGARRMLAEWLITDTARETVRDLLAPFDALGPEKSTTAVQTLHAYLDEQGSLKRAAARLHVHRNAVVYRLEIIKGTLGLDINDPDNRFALQLACRARLMVAGLL